MLDTIWTTWGGHICDIKHSDPEGEKGKDLDVKKESCGENPDTSVGRTQLGGNRSLMKTGEFGKGLDGCLSAWRMDGGLSSLLAGMRKDSQIHQMMYATGQGKHTFILMAILFTNFDSCCKAQGENGLGCAPNPPPPSQSSSRWRCPALAHAPRHQTATGHIKNVQIKKEYRHPPCPHSFMHRKIHH